MQISDTGYNISNGTNNSIRLNNFRENVNENPKQNPSGNNLFTQISEGQLFRGQILNITRENVSILLDNNSRVQATLGEEVTLNIGDNIVFQVKENNGESVVIRPFADSTDQIKDNTIFKILDNNNFSPTVKNYQIAETLMNNNMPVDKNTMQRIMQQSFKYPDVSVDTLVSMNKLGLPVNEQTIGQYEAYLNNNHQLMKNINDFTENIIDFSVKMYDEIGQGNVTSTDLYGDVLEFNKNLLGCISDENDFATNYETNADTLVSVADSAGTEVKEILDYLRNSGYEKETLVKIADSSETPLKFLNNINELLYNSPETAFDAKEFFSLKGYKELLGKAIKDKFTLNPADMKNPKEIDELYQSISDKTGKIIETFAQKGGESGKNLASSAKNMQERMDFIQNLNEIYSYAQLPVKMSSAEVNSELFVYLNKRRMQDKKEDVSALLHLDMQFLGPTDVHVSLRGNMVHTKFYVEDEISAKILDEHMNILEKAVNESGFSLSNEVITREAALATPTNMVVEELLGNDLEQSVKRYSFDVRM